MAQNRTEQAHIQSEFCQKNFGRSLKIIWGLLMIIYLLTGYIIYKYVHQPIPKYFVTTTDGQLLEITPH